MLCEHLLSRSEGCDGAGCCGTHSTAGRRKRGEGREGEEERRVKGEGEQIEGRRGRRGERVREGGEEIEGRRGR